MRDTCEIRRPPPAQTGTSETGTLNAATGEISGLPDEQAGGGPTGADPIPGASPLVYGDGVSGQGRTLDGRCLVHPALKGSRTTVAIVVGDATLDETRYLVKIPWDAPEVRTGDEVTILSSKDDPLLAGRTMVVRGIGRSSTVISRDLLAELMD